AVMGTHVVALCGEVFPVTRSPKPGSPVCPECKNICTVQVQLTFSPGELRACAPGAVRGVSRGDTGRQRTAGHTPRGGYLELRVFCAGAVAGARHVADAAVLAVPDDVMGEKVGAVLFADGAEIDVDAVIAHCREQLADFKVPQYVTVVDQALPRNAGGKLLKAQLREQIRWGAPLR
ncbi:DUF3039 domain-containing protein, partial [Nocardia cyriacigeorgica]|uniref:DUF3039 domain-containing protein n=1 Tax=Nocardia cyriacigeorgica TaxID=135487 RepID=UPI0024577C1F